MTSDPSLYVDVRGVVGHLALDLQLAAGPGPTAVVGPNGAGKSSLLRIIAGSLQPTAGRVVLGGTLLCDGDAGVCLPPEARGVGYMPQGYALFPHLTALENVAFGLAYHRRGESRGTRRARALALLDELGVGHVAKRRPATMSGGEQQRVALARALAVEPRVLLLDEPLAALDVNARASTRALLASRLAALGRPTLLVTHDVRDLIALQAPLIVVEGGRVVQSGPLAEIAAAPATPFVAELLSPIHLHLAT